MFAAMISFLFFVITYRFYNTNRACVANVSSIDNTPTMLTAHVTHLQGGGDGGEFLYFRQFYRIMKYLTKRRAIIFSNNFF
jgi:hypothetical protein